MKRRSGSPTQDEIASWFDGKSFSTDWTSWHFPNWAKLLRPYRGRAVSVLEIGSWEGRSALFFLNFMPKAKLTCVDTFAGGQEHQEAAARSAEDAETLRTVEKRFDANVKPFKKRVEKIKAQSAGRARRTRHRQPPLRHRLYRRRSSRDRSLHRLGLDLAADEARRSRDLRRLSMGRDAEENGQPETRHRRVPEKHRRPVSRGLQEISGRDRKALTSPSARTSSMPLDAFSLARRLRAGEIVYSAWCGLPEPLVCEAIAREGFSAVTLDMQHGMWDEASALQAIAQHSSGGRGSDRARAAVAELAGQPHARLGRRRHHRADDQRRGRSARLRAGRQISAARRSFDRRASRRNAGAPAGPEALYRRRQCRHHHLRHDREPRGDGQSRCHRGDAR